MVIRASPPDSIVGVGERPQPTDLAARALRRSGFCAQSRWYAGLDLFLSPSSPTPMSATRWRLPERIRGSGRIPAAQGKIGNKKRQPWYHGNSVSTPRKG